MADTPPNFLKQNSWLFVLAGIVALVFVGYVVKQQATYNAQLVMHNATIQEIGQTRPTSGMYTIKGGRLNYVYAQAVGFANDHDKDAGTAYDSYVPVVDDKTREVVMLALMQGESPKNMWAHIDDPAETITGSFTDPNSVPPEIANDFINRHYSVPAGIPLIVVPGGIEPSALHRRIAIAAILAVLAAGVPWLVMFLLNRPAKPQKRFSDRYPNRRVY